MNTSDFFYDLPKELIAQTPLEKRDTSRLLVLDKHSGKVEHRVFADIIDLLNKNDCLILNDTRVLPARLFGKRTDSGAIVEFLLLNNKGSDMWECLAGPGKKAKIGNAFVFKENLLTAQVVDITAEGNRILKFKYNGSFFAVLDEIGQMPLPPYITEKLMDKERYQTVYSKELGSAAAPTAGLHFTRELIDKINEKGIKIGFVTLHVGLGTFRPVKAKKIEDHIMHAEHYFIPDKTLEMIETTKQNGGKVIAVGTTCCRTLESYANTNKTEDFTSIFIYPGYNFKCIDGLITNFHLPESTLIMLVSAFSGYENVMNAYKIAVEEKYRFFSFGDAMLIL